MVIFLVVLSDRPDTNPLSLIFFFRTHTKWNNLSFNIREIDNSYNFKIELKKYLWSTLTFDDISASENEDLLDHG